ncbi:MAG TPA: hypothetical protein VJ644_06680 [Jiangellaceae bacterium]|nr:hypothetical protein [Jiangellaceae bacterium]
MIAQNPDKYVDLVAVEDRARFRLPAPDRADVADGAAGRQEDPR